MGRPPSNGGPAFRFTQAEVVEMEAILQDHHNTMPTRETLVGLAAKFSETADRKGKIQVQMKQVWNWFQNRRYAIRAKTVKVPGKLNVMPVPRDDLTPTRSVPQPTTTPVSSPALVSSSKPASSASSVSTAGRVAPEVTLMEFEAKSARDGAWYDVAVFLGQRNIETGELEVQVRFAGFGPEEDEWVNVKKHVRQRSLPCEASECVAVLPGDLILCFQEGKDQALYYDAHVLDAQRRRHDVRGCRCRFLVRYDHDQSEEIVPLRKVCRRPETDYRLQQLHAINDSVSLDQPKTPGDASILNPQRNISPMEMMQKSSIAIVAAPTSAPLLQASVPAAPVLQASVPAAAPVLQASVPAAPPAIIPEFKVGSSHAVNPSNPAVLPSGYPVTTGTSTTVNPQPPVGAMHGN